MENTELSKTRHGSFEYSDKAGWYVGHYEGYRDGGKLPHGEGVLTCYDERIYLGNWEHGVIGGYGTISFPSPLDSSP